MPLIANLVRVLSSTTGTGTLTLGSAVSGFLTPTQSGMVDGRVYSYAIEADYVTVGDDLVPTSREVGHGTYTASGGTLTRVVTNSTNSNALLTLTGDEQVIIAVLAESIPEILDADRNYYVRTDGNDANTGLANTSGAAWLTLQKAYDVVKLLNFNTKNVTINVADGTYTGGVSVTSSWSGGGTLTWTGNAGTPANCLVSTTNASCFLISGAQMSGPMIVNGFKLTSATSGSLLNIGGGASAFLKGTNLDFGASASNHLECTGSAGARMQLTGNYTISGNAGFHLFAIGQANIQCNSMTVTLTGTPAFTIFCYATRMAFIDVEAVTYSGGASAGTTRYVAGENSVIYTNSSANPTYFPGGTGGSTQSGGQYL
jgi:hypothetical protein